MTTVLYSGSALTPLPYPGIPEQWNAPMVARAREDLDLVIAHMPGTAEHVQEIDPSGDVEDFWEEAARTAAAIRAASSTGAAFTHAPTTRDWDAEAMAQRLGPVSTLEESRHAHDPLLMHDVLVAHGGRWMTRAGIGEPGELPADEDAVTLLHGRAQQGVRRIVVKLAARKSGVFTVDLDPTMRPDDVRQALFDGVDGWELIRLEGQRGALLVQDWIPMACEYRLFVVDGQVISGAGCIEEFTPYARADADVLFDPRVRRARGNAVAGDEDTPVTEEPELVKRYREAGRRIAENHRGTVVIDLAVNRETDEIVVVELNTLPNAGLYASNIDAVYQALVTATDRGYGEYGWNPRIKHGRK